MGLLFKESLRIIDFGQEILFRNLILIPIFLLIVFLLLRLPWRVKLLLFLLRISAFRIKAIVLTTIGRKRVVSEDGIAAIIIINNYSVWLITTFVARIQLS